MTSFQFKEHFRHHSRERGEMTLERHKHGIWSEMEPPQNRRELAELHDADNFPQYFRIQCGIQVSPFIINNCFILNLHKENAFLCCFQKTKQISKICSRSVPTCPQTCHRECYTHPVCTLYNTPTHIVHCTTS